MGKQGTKIQWAIVPGYRGATLNPMHAVLKPEFQAEAVAAGKKPNAKTGWFCVKVKDRNGRTRLGCAGCYAEAQNMRMGNGLPYHASQADKLDFRLDHLGDLRKTKEPTSWFVDSMTDLFLEYYPDEMIRAVIDEMMAVDRHLYIILTKRPDRMKSILDRYYPDMHKWGHIWWGVSCEDQSSANEMIPPLLDTNVALRVVSYEPAVGPVDWDEAHWGMNVMGKPWPRKTVDWFLVGGMSKQRAIKPLPFHAEWAFNTTDWARKHDALVFVKQAGSAPFVGGVPFECSDSHGSEPAEWPVPMRVREFPTLEPA
jgi:protein gp37